MVEERTRKILFLTVLLILLWPLSMIILGVRYRNECPGQPQLSIYLIIFGPIWIFLFLLNIIRYYLFHRYIDIIFIIIWLSLILLIIPGYIYIFDLRSIIRISDEYPYEICEKQFYTYSSISIILVHIPLYVFLWISWSLTHSKDNLRNQQRSIRRFTIEYLFNFNKRENKISLVTLFILERNFLLKMLIDGLFD
jgi:hypothetical protein